MAIDRVCQHDTAKEHDFRHQENPHSERRSVLLLLQRLNCPNSAPVRCTSHSPIRQFQAPIARLSPGATSGIRFSRPREPAPMRKPRVAGNVQFQGRADCESHKPPKSPRE